MPIPKTPEFEALLESLRIQPPDDLSNWREEKLVQEEVVVHGNRYEKLPSIDVWYRQEGLLGLEALVRKTQEELNRSGHHASNPLARVVLAFFAAAEHASRSSVDRFNELLTHVVPADLNQYFLFSIPGPPAYRFRAGRFGIGPFDPFRLEYQCKKAQSDYFHRYESVLRAMPLSVEGDPVRIKVVGWHKLLGSNCAWSPRSDIPRATGERLWNEYFSQLSSVYFEEFFAALYLAQEPGIALGSGWFDPVGLKELIGTHRISVFLNIGSENVGFVSPSSIMHVGIDLGGAHLGIPATTKALKTHFDFSEFSDCEIHQMMQSYFHFLALATLHHHGGRDAEGFLHNVIAMELLLGERTITAQSVAKRSAGLTFVPRGKSFFDAYRDCELIYDARSRYVHSGKHPDAALWPVATEITREIAFCLLRLQRDPENRQRGFRDQWVKTIDYVAAALDAGRPPTRADLTGIGVADEDSFGLVDYRALLRLPKHV